MNLRAMYRIYLKPVRLEKVSEGLWVTSSEQAQLETEEDFFRSADLFKEPMTKAQSTDPRNIERRNR